MFVGALKALSFSRIQCPFKNFRSAMFAPALQSGCATDAGVLSLPIPRE
jgi:hypothetical protein